MGGVYPDHKRWGAEWGHPWVTQWTCCTCQLTQGPFITWAYFLSSSFSEARSLKVLWFSNCLGTRDHLILPNTLAEPHETWDYAFFLTWVGDLHGVNPMPSADLGSGVERWRRIARDLQADIIFLMTLYSAFYPSQPRDQTFISSLSPAAFLLPKEW